MSAVLFTVKELVMSEVDWICKRSHLRALLEQHPDWSERQLADAVGCSRSTVTRWKKRFAQAENNDVTVLFSHSRAPHHHPPRISDEVKERIEEIRLSPPDNLKRTPGRYPLSCTTSRRMKRSACKACACLVPPERFGRSWTKRA